MEHGFDDWRKVNNTDEFMTIHAQNTHNKQIKGEKLKISLRN